MDLKTTNAMLSSGDIDAVGLFPHLDRLQDARYIFKTEFGLDTLPIEPGILLIRGARQYGKSTWLEQQLRNTIVEFGPGSAFYLNGDDIADHNALEVAIDDLITAYRKDAPVRRLFIDEITSVENWETTLKRMADKGKFARILVVTTGSKATDLRRGAERLPGRKGKLARSNYLFAPISFKEFHRVCGSKLGKKALLTYLISGGSPIACAELTIHGYIPEYVIELVRDWIEGEIARSGRNRSSLVNIMSVLHRLGSSPVGQAKLAREAALANNTIAQGYIEILNDLACVIPSYPWDQHRKILILRKPCKYQFTNLLAAIAYHPARIRSVADFLSLGEREQGIWYEWLIAQEILRLEAIKGTRLLDPLSFWQNSENEIDFVVNSEQFIEVKRGKCSPHEFSWFPRQFPGEQLAVVSSSQFETDFVQGILFEDFLTRT